MVPSFKTKELREICESADKAKEILGVDNAEKLKTFLADIHAAKNIYDLPNHDPQVDGEKCTFELSKKLLIRMVSNHPQNPVTRDNLIEWTEVKRIKLIEIERSR